VNLGSDPPPKINLLNSKKILGKCFSCGKPAKTEIYFARSY